MQNKDIPLNILTNENKSRYLITQTSTKHAQNSGIPQEHGNRIILSQVLCISLVEFDKLRTTKQYSFPHICFHHLTSHVKCQNIVSASKNNIS